MKTMDHINGNGAGGAFSAMLSFISALLAVITLKDVQIYFSIAASTIAVASGLFAIRYYIKKSKS
jgi:hypothetical protein